MPRVPLHREPDHSVSLAVNGGAIWRRAPADVSDLKAERMGKAGILEQVRGTDMQIEEPG